MWPRYSNSVAQRSTYRHNFSASLISQFNPNRVLDVGSGSGAGLSLLPKNIFSVGLENSERSANVSAQNLGVIVVVADASRLPFADAAFDVVSMLEVLEHIPISKVDLCLSEINYVMRDGGTAVISVPFGAWISKLADPAWIFGHRHYSKTALRELMFRAGLMVQDMQTKGGMYELLGMINLYICKWIFGRAMIAQSFFERNRRREYELKSQGFATLFVIAQKGIFV
jgi:ubiquinone/menaquinone biosynthesis C-methylase UbiE